MTKLKNHIHPLVDEMPHHWPDWTTALLQASNMAEKAGDDKSYDWFNRTRNNIIKSMNKLGDVQNNYNPELIDAVDELIEAVGDRVQNQGCRCNGLYTCHSCLKADIRISDAYQKYQRIAGGLDKQTGHHLDCGCVACDPANYF